MLALLLRSVPTLLLVKVSLIIVKGEGGLDGVCYFILLKHFPIVPHCNQLDVNSVYLYKYG